MIIWLVQNIFYPYPYISLVILGIVTVITGYGVYYQLHMGIRYYLSKKKLLSQLRDLVKSK